MTQEEKELVLKDICARLPYGVYVSVHDTFEYSTVPYENVYLKSSDISFLIDSISLNEKYNSRDKRFNSIIKERKDFLEFKPFLFPLSSMTEEQKQESPFESSLLNAFINGYISLFEDEELRDKLDIKIYVDTEDDIRILRRIQRDIKERGRSIDSVVEQYLTSVKPMHDQFIEPNKKLADIIVPEGGENKVAYDMLVNTIMTKIKK